MLAVNSGFLPQYSWNQRGDSATLSAACATHSIGRLDIVLNTNGSPSDAAALVLATSESSWTICCTPTGPRRIGAGNPGPSNSTPKSRFRTSPDIRGQIPRL